MDLFYRKIIILFAVLFAVQAFMLSATPGDVTEVQTFTFDDISEQRMVFDFPDDERKWSKILMYYTLKCDEATTGDKYPCGEWDVSTFTYVYKHTGEMERRKFTHPLFIVNGESPDEFHYSTEPVYNYYTDWLIDCSPVDESDKYLKFEGTDYIKVPAEAVQTIGTSFTISMWVKGDDSQPVNGNIVEAMDKGGRVLNIHLPWGTGEVYFDAGGRLMGNNNRIQKSAEPGSFKGRWNHWAFTRDTEKGEQKIFLNGKLWHSAPNMNKTIDAVDSFVIGANGNGNGGYYKGSIDEVRIWDVALDESVIAEWQFKDVDESHPQFGHLKVDYRFDELSVGKVADSSPHGYDGTTFGQPQLMKYGVAGKNDRKPGAGDVLLTQQVEAQKVTVTLFEDEKNPEKETVTMNVWEAVEKYYDGSGRLLEEKPLEEYEILENTEHEYFGEEFEILERYEIGRFITPYGKRLDLGDDGFTWIYDVTDYAPLLKGEVDLQAANDFELLDLRFEFTEGTPARGVLSVENIWTENSSNYKDIVDEGKFKAQVLKADEEGKGFMVRSRISGHGHYGPRNCCEWDPKDHYLYINGIKRFDWNVWRDCGMNPVHPQGGTWQFDRAGWCPGTWVDTYDHEITPYVTSGKEFAIDYTMQPYDAEIEEQGGSYLVEHQLFTYGKPNFKNDAELVEIISPNDHDEYRRMNPVSVSPVIKIKNTGKELLKTLTIEYGLKNKDLSVYEWQGELGFLESETVVLPKPEWKGMKKGSDFVVTLKDPNGKADENRLNDSLTVKTVKPIVLPESFIFYYKSQGFERASHNALIIRNAEGETVYKKSDFEDNKEYNLEIELEPGSYQLDFTDSEEEGLIRHWWLRGHAPDEIGENGRIQIRNKKDKIIRELGYDFAEKRTVRFFVGGVR